MFFSHTRRLAVCPLHRSARDSLLPIAMEKKGREEYRADESTLLSTRTAKSQRPSLSSTAIGSRHRMIYRQMIRKHGRRTMSTTHRSCHVSLCEQDPYGTTIFLTMREQSSSCDLDAVSVTLAQRTTHLIGRMTRRMRVLNHERCSNKLLKMIVLHDDAFISRWKIK